MELDKDHTANHMMGTMGKLMRKCIYRMLSSGPIPDHFAFILDGNRRYAKKWNLPEGDGHKAGFISLLGVCRYLYEMGVKYITVYAFSIDNFKRKPHFVDYLMNLLLYKSEILLKQESIVNVYGIKIHFVGNFKLLSEPVQAAAEKLMETTRNNNKAVLLVCLAYTSTDEIAHAVQESCNEKVQEIIEQNNGESFIPAIGKKGKGMVMNRKSENGEGFPVITLADVEKHMYMAVASDPCVLVRTSGETRLSNYLLWQTSHCILYSPETLWPEIGLWDLVWAVILWQRNYSYLEKKKKQI